MPLEVKIGKETAEVKILEKNNNMVSVSIDNRIYELDIMEVGSGIYSVLHKGKSYNVELVQGKTSRDYLVNTMYKNFDVSIIDAQSRYLESRNKGSLAEGQNTITCPMPGKVVRIEVKEGAEVKTGQALIIISAMKMESEYKAGKDGKVKKIHVKEGDTVNGGQILIELE